MEMHAEHRSLLALNRCTNTLQVVVTECDPQVHTTDSIKVIEKKRGITYKFEDQDRYDKANKRFPVLLGQTCQPYRGLGISQVNHRWKHGWNLVIIWCPDINDNVHTRRHPEFKRNKVQPAMGHYWWRAE